jgi:hypothetical protein
MREWWKALPSKKRRRAASWSMVPFQCFGFWVLDSVWPIGVHWIVPAVGIIGATPLIVWWDDWVCQDTDRLEEARRTKVTSSPTLEGNS